MLVLFLLACPRVGTSIQVGLDPSYEFAFNYSFAHDLLVGKDILFTFGPLGFLLFPQPIGNNFAWGTTFAFLVTLGYIYFSYSLASQLRPRSKLLNLLLTFLGVVASNPGLDLVMVTGFLVEYAQVHGNSKYRFGAVVVSATAFLAKSTFGILTLLILVSDALVTILEERAGRRAILAGLKTLSAWVASVCGIWLLLYRTLAGLPAYVFSMWLFASGNSSAMTFSPKVYWVHLVLSCAFLVAVPLLVGTRATWRLFLVFAAPLVAYWKYAISRIDHIPQFSVLLFLFLLLAILRSAPQRKVHAIALSFLSFYFFNVEVARLGYHAPQPFALAANAITEMNYSWISDVFGHRSKSLKDLSERQLKQSELSPDLRQIIGMSTVDVYPFELSYVAANNLNWKPRPIIQSYAAYEPWLDERDAQFLASDIAPKFILWHALTMESIDGRYLLNDEPATALAILSHYRLRAVAGKVALLERTAEPALVHDGTSESVAGSWGEWIELPPHDPDRVVAAKVLFRRTPLGLLKKLFYKEDTFHIEYVSEFGETKRYRLVVDNAEQGLLVSPLVSTIGSDGFSSQKIVRFRVLHSPDDYLSAKLEVRWDHYSPR